MAKKQESMAASLNPDDMLAGGLKDDFRGTITEATYVRWDYDGNIDEPVLAARLTIQPEGEDTPFVQHWSAGDLAAFVPSEDGVTPAGEDEPGPYALRVGKRAQLNNNTNFAHLISSIVDSGEAAKKFTRDDLNATPGSLECLEGLDCHWNRVPQKKRSGLVDADGGTKARDVLVVTEVFGYREEVGKSAKKSAGKSMAPAATNKGAAKAADNGGGDLDERLQEIIVEALSEAPKNTIKKGKLATLVLTAMAQDKNKAAGVKRCSQTDFLGDDDRPWTYDADEGTVSLG